jgi:hypothetical protein
MKLFADAIKHNPRVRLFAPTNHKHVKAHQESLSQRVEKP